jgi:Na+/proline symporter
MENRAMDRKTKWLWITCKCVFLLFYLGILALSHHSTSKISSIGVAYSSNVLAGLTCVLLWRNIDVEAVRAISCVVILGLTWFLCLYFLNCPSNVSQAIEAIPIILFGAPGPLQMKRLSKSKRDE